MPNYSWSLVPRADGFIFGSDGKESAWNAGDLGLIHGWERFAGEGNGNPLQYSCLENAVDKGSLVGYRPWGPKELDTTEQLKLPFFFFFSLTRVKREFTFFCTEYCSALKCTEYCILLECSLPCFSIPPHLTIHSPFSPGLYSVPQRMEA